MGVMECQRPNCPNIMCDRRVDDRYLCNGCAAEFEGWRRDDMDRDPNSTVAVELFDLFDTAVAADTYGYDDDVLMCALYEWAGPVTDAEISRYAATFTTPDAVADGCTAEDADRAVRLLTAWRDRHRHLFVEG